MAAFKAAFMNELSRLLRKNKIVIFILLDIVVCALAILLPKLISMTPITVTSESMALNLLTVFCEYVLPVYVVMLTLEAFTAQYHDKTIITILVRPITRFKIYLSKIAAVSAFALSHLLLILLIAIVFRFSQNIGMGKLILAYLVSALPLVVLSVVVALLAQMVKNGLLGMLISILFLVLAKVFAMFFIMPASFLFTTYFGWFKLFITGHFRPMHILATFVLLCAYGLFAYVLGYMLFDKKEF